MKNVTIKREEYEEAVYPAVALSRPKTNDQIANGLAVRSKLRDLGFQKPQTESAKEQGYPALYTMVEDEAVIAFENAEADWLRAELLKSLEEGRFMLDAADYARSVRDRLEKAPGEIGQDGVSEERKAAVEAGD